MWEECIAVRGHGDDSSVDPESNRGNFLALLDYNIESGNSALARHLQESSKNSIYTSKTIQNDLIDCIGSHIRDNILKEIKNLSIWVSEASPTLGCLIEISRDTYIYIYVSVMVQKA